MQRGVSRRGQSHPGLWAHSLVYKSLPQIQRRHQGHHLIHGWALVYVVAQCSKQLQLAQGYNPSTCNWLLHPAPTSAQDGLDHLELALVVFSCHQLAQRPHLHLQWASHTWNGRNHTLLVCRHITPLQPRLLDD